MKTISLPPLFFFFGVKWTAHNTSSTSVRISWKAPPTDTIHGEFLGYRITYRARDKQPEDIKEIYIRDSNVEVCAVINLNYDFVCCAFNGIKRRSFKNFNLFILFPSLPSLRIRAEPWNHESRDFHPILGFTSSLQSWGTRSQFDCSDYDWWRR